MVNNKNNPLGVFDSGLGGLTVVRALKRQLPGEDIVYYGDTARVPYGTKSKKSIIDFSIENTRALLKHNVKMIIVACNSSSSYALNILKKEFHVPIIGVIHAGAKKAVTLTKNKRVGVIATCATITSCAYTKAIKRHDKEVRVFTRTCPLFVPLVEEGWFTQPVSTNIAKEYLASLKRANIDTLILGCTHYPLLKSVIQKVMGTKVVLVDSAREIASEVKNYLKDAESLKVLKRKPRYKFLITDRPQEFKRIAKNFLGEDTKYIVKV